VVSLGSLEADNGLMALADFFSLVEAVGGLVALADFVLPVTFGGLFFLPLA
jgi:hypothetical protein